MCERSDTAGCEARWRTGSSIVEGLGGRSAVRGGQGAVTQWAVRLAGELAAVLSIAWVGGRLADRGRGTVVDIKGYYPISKDIKGYYPISNSSILLGIPSKRLFFLARASKERKVSPNV